MPLASPSSLTSNTLATFLDHVPISTNNAEKWKPKQMGSNSGGDYRALSRALSAPPLGTEGWIQRRLFLSAATEVGGEETFAAICLQVTEICAARFKWPLLSSLREEWIRKLDASLNCSFCCILYSFSLKKNQRCPPVLFACACVWNSSQTGPCCCRSCFACCLRATPHTAAAVFCAADWHTKAAHCCEDILGCFGCDPRLFGRKEKKKKTACAYRAVIRLRSSPPGPWNMCATPF